MKYLKTFEGIFDMFKNKKEVYIHKIIDIEVKKSYQFGLKIEKSDIDLEKKILTQIFMEFWDDIKNANSIKYDILRRTISEEVNRCFKDRMEYYFSKNYSVKNMYNCHLDNVLSHLFMGISNLN